MAGEVAGVTDAASSDLAASELEKTSAWIQREFSEVLGEPASPQDDFFALGGTSLGAAKLAMRLTARSGKSVSLADVLRDRTPEGLAASLAKAGPAPGLRSDAPSAGDASPLSHSQRWYSWVYRGDQLPRAVICFTTELPDGTSIAALRAALILMTERHDALRLGISARGDGLVQHLIPASSMADLLRAGGRDDGGPVKVAEVSGGRAEVARETDRIRLREQAAGMPLGQGPMFRAVFVHGDQPDGQQPAQLVMTVHHLIFDGTSLGLFIDEITQACRNPARLGEPPASFRKYAFASGRDERASDNETARHWWREYLSGFDGPCHLPIGQADPATPTWATEGTMPDRLWQALSTMARTCRVPVSVLRLAGALIVVHALYDTSDAAVCMPVDGREPPWDATIGMFIDCVAIRHRARPGESVRDMVDEIASNLPKILQYHHLGFDRVVSDVKGAEVEGRYPISGVILNGAAGARSGPRLDEPTSNPIGRKMLFDLQVFFIDYPDRTDLEIQHRSELLTQAEGARLLDATLLVLTRLADSGTAQVAELVREARRSLALRTGPA